MSDDGPERMEQSTVKKEHIYHNSMSAVKIRLNEYGRIVSGEVNARSFSVEMAAELAMMKIGELREEIAKNPKKPAKPEKTTVSQTQDEGKEPQVEDAHEDGGN